MDYSITVKIAEAGTPLKEGGNSAVGHTWLVLSSAQNGLQSYGFAPTVHGEPFGPGKIYTTDDSNYTQVSYSRTVSLTEAQYAAIHAFVDDCYLRGSFGDYNGIRNSCIDFVYSALRQVGLEVNGTANDGVVWPTWNAGLYDSYVAQLSVQTETRKRRCPARVDAFP